MTHPVVSAIRAALAATGDPERAAAQQAYMRSQMPYRGITAPELKTLLRPILADPAHRIAERGEWERAVRDLWDGATHREERYAATALTGQRTYRAWQDPDTLRLYEHLVVTGAWWDHVDEVASNRIGPILLSHKEEVTPRVEQWIEHEDLWLRRTSIICQLTFKERTDLGLLRAAIEPNLEDPSFWIRKAIGWALRQYARTDPDWVRATVAEYDGRLSGLSRREALKHL
ncbi:DNA alkylation repair protein [Phycicoccus sp. Soil802]|uniref:DNA alkylation repair protein n=1 Tax=Phycicoccus sp. Soil802 TaxID=1736414 RepID=UPI000702DC28|nr:DNA alkylation repair protein [Phycicoccus sp. Soil802]KRF28879.1 DNA alkylation repair protein [Phycicoccus sp. Soil802]